MVAVVADDELDAMFAALTDPTRRSILTRLSTGDATVNELAAPFDISLQAVSKHIQVLEHAGLITRSRHRQTRPCRLNTERCATAANWIENNVAVWTDRFDRLEQHLDNLQKPTSPRK
jgi:DNA-binding transcriptional ArsR family regulator